MSQVARRAGPLGYFTSKGLYRQHKLSLRHKLREDRLMQTDMCFRWGMLWKGDMYIPFGGESLIVTRGLDLY